MRAEDIMYLHTVFATGLYKQDLDNFQWNIWCPTPDTMLPGCTVYISRLDLVDPNKDIWSADFI